MPAEMNAILNKNTASIVGATIYVALFPCNEWYVRVASLLICVFNARHVVHRSAKLIIQSGIRNVVYLSDKHHDA